MAEHLTDKQSRYLLCNHPHIDISQVKSEAQLHAMMDCQIETYDIPRLVPGDKPFSYIPNNIVTEE